MSVCVGSLLLFGLMCSEVAAGSQTARRPVIAFPIVQFGLKPHTVATPPTTTPSESEESEEEDINWQCGTDEISKMLSESTVEQTCPLLKVVINSCCLTHDDCYDGQLGLKFCDDTFCSCLDNVTKGHEACNQGEAIIFCDLVRRYGLGAYEAAGNATALHLANSTSTARTSTATPSTTTTTVSSSQRPLPKIIFRTTVKPVSPITARYRLFSSLTFDDARSRYGPVVLP